MNKVYVDVVAEFWKDGKLVPIFFTWEDGRKYNIPKFVSKGELENEPIMTNNMPRRRIFIYYDDDMNWDTVDPMIDEKEYLSLDWERYANKIKLANDLDDEVKDIWLVMLEESQK